MPEPRGNEVYISMFVDSDLARENTPRRSQTGVLIFINKAPIHWYIKSQENVESSNFEADFCYIKEDLEIVEDLRYKIKMVGVPIDGSSNVFCNNEAVLKNAITLESVLNTHRHYI